MEIKTFEEILKDKKIVVALKEMGYERPTKAQSDILPIMLENKDIIVKSPTGSGKTTAFGIPLIDGVNVENNAIQALVLAPTRELAVQVCEELSRIGRIKGVRSIAIYGKESFGDQVNLLKQRVHIVVATPGRFLDHINRGTISTSNIEKFILDEGDKMLSMGFMKEINDILKNLKNIKSGGIFSATIPEAIAQVSETYLNKPIQVEIEQESIDGGVEDFYIMCDNEGKDRLLEELIYSEEVNSAVVFCNTKDMVRKVSAYLKKVKIDNNIINGDMEQKDRLKVMKSFKNHEFRILVATDIAARGIHVDELSHVFNYEIPMEMDAYAHRIGRTGRSGHSGKAISLVSPRDRKFLDAIGEHLNISIPSMKRPSGEEVEVGRATYRFKEKTVRKAPVKQAPTSVSKIYIGAGKKKKIRNIDIVGALSNTPGIDSMDIGVINVQDGFTYVDILNNKGKTLLKNHKSIKIKGKNVKIQDAKG